MTSEKVAGKARFRVAPGFVIGLKYLGITWLRQFVWSCHIGGWKKYFRSCANFDSIKIDLIAYKRVPNAYLWTLDLSLMGYISGSNSRTTAPELLTSDVGSRTARFVPAECLAAV